MALLNTQHQHTIYYPFGSTFSIQYLYGFPGELEHQMRNHTANDIRITLWQNNNISTRASYPLR